MSFSNAKPLHRFRGKLELSVNTTHPKSHVHKEDDMSLAAFTLAERLARWPFDPPVKLARLKHLRHDDIVNAVAGLVTWVHCAACIVSTCVRACANASLVLNGAK